ncbi:MAG: ATP-dependent DNA helicase RecG [Candidatus Aminicenantia bacterium]
MKLSFFFTVENIKGIGQKRAVLLKKSGIFNVEDLLYYFPFRYEDRRRIWKIADLETNQNAAVKGKIVARNSSISPRKRIHILKAVMTDGENKLGLIWFNQPFLAKLIKKGEEIVVYGQPKIGASPKVKWIMDNPQFEILNKKEENLSVGRIIPIYQRIGRFSGKMIRKIISNLIPLISIPENLPLEIRDKYNFPSRKEALSEVHFPSGKNSLEALNHFSSSAHLRIKYEELFLFQLSLAYFRQKIVNVNKNRNYKLTPKVKHIWKNLFPFILTSEQQKVLDEIICDLLSPRPMRRLLQGEVGSGKTAVAVLALALVMENGYQTAFMAPTEVLAEQHYLRLREIFKNYPYQITLLTGSTPKKEKEDILNDLRQGKISLIIGTHSLFQPQVKFKNLALVVIDEQHKFGVAQRSMLYYKGQETDLLVMTATPIPRSLALTLYSDLDLSTIKEMPHGRKPVKSYLITEKKRERLYNWIEKKLIEGNQGYIVFPLIEETEKDGFYDLKSAVESFEILKERFSGFKVGLLHGRMKAQEKAEVMNDFRKGKINLLVSTSVIEVGIDIANAVFIVVENAERFGLAQLHQLRGRVGRGVDESYCFFLGREKIGSDAWKRLKILTETNDGFKIAEQDLILRGPGQPLGKAQWGYLNFKLANIIEDRELLEKAKKDAFQIVREKKFDLPELEPYFELWKRKEKEISFS